MKMKAIKNEELNKIRCPHCHEEIILLEEPDKKEWTMKDERAFNLGVKSISRPISKHDSRDDFWDKDKVTQLKRLAIQGKKIREIAKEFGTSYGRIWSAIKKFGVVKIVRAGRDERRDIEPTNDRYSSHHRSWSMDDEHKLMSLRQKGLSWGKIAKILRRTKSGVATRANLLKRGKGNSFSSEVAKITRGIKPEGYSRKSNILLFNGGKRWSDEENQKLIEEYISGMSRKEMGLRHGRTIATISVQLTGLRKKGILKYKKPIKETGQGIGRGDKVTLEQDVQIKQLREHGYSFKQIGKMLDIPKATIGWRINKSKAYRLHTAVSDFNSEQKAKLG